MKIRTSLLWKLTLAFMLVAVTTAALVAIFIRVTSVDRLTRLIIDQQRSSLQISLADYYQNNGSWAGVADNWQQIRQRSFSTAVVPTNDHGGTRNDFPNAVIVRDRRRFFGLADAQGRILIPIDPHNPVGSAVSPADLQSGSPVMVNGKQVGTLLAPTFLPGLNPEENLYLQRTNEALLYAVIGAMIVSLLIGILLASTLIRPLQALTQAAQNITEGDLAQQVKVTSKDEIGQLAFAFNRMSEEVTRVNHLRRQMTADIAHDLRTPLTVIAGYVESMRDGVLQPTTERLALIYTEIERLQNLVGDLKMLSQVDAGELPLHPQSITPKSILERAVAPFQHRAEKQNVSLRVAADDHLPEISVDESRMMQVMSNLLSNALRYTPEGGQIELTATQSNGSVELNVIDNGAGIPAEDLPYIFDRFYRVDKARSYDTGETGLGLAIVKALVEAHGGTICAESNPGAGTIVHIRLPVATKTLSA